MFSLSRQEKIVLLLILSILLATFGWKIYSRKENTITIIPSDKKSELIDQKTEEATEEEICIIHISGAVHKPGVYQLNKGERIVNAVKMAGGETEKANLEAVNLAAHLYDGQKIIIPFIPENNENMPAGIDRSYEMSRQQTYTTDSSSLLNLNTVILHQLETLPGIGPVLAERILEYRENNGMFRFIEEVMNVPGIGEKKFESIKEYITVY